MSEDSEDVAREAILKRIAETAPRTTSAQAVAHLAEAYAWIISPNQSHGGSVQVQK